ncbi:uncharacterized protein LOC117326734 [Pecten maximus]|uniref:uncharacterized protein LOC117326734 n=1 Tax=Pecten maximus TaxID=6579 RepID=UPI0014591819|nr:uncharacterized protein LOC117326734 [Pecten maximus]
MYSKDIVSRNYDEHHSYNRISATCYLPYTFVWSTQYETQTDHLTFTLQLSALANVIDLMLLPTVPHKSVNRRRGFNSQSEEDMLSADMERMLLRIKAELEKKFPLTIKNLYHQVLPYVFWARGLISKAAHLFSDLASKEEKCRMKARYLYEVGRMYSHFDEAETAIVFYKGAEDAVLAKSKHRTERIIREVEQQTKDLCADAYDQGPMTRLKAEQASKSWTLAIHFADRERLQTPHPGIYAAESLLCFHARIGRDDVKSWLLSCVECLERIAQSCPAVYFYLSQIYAWAGMTKDSTTAYRTYVNKGYVGGSTLAPGQETSSSGRISRQPWGVLLLMVQRPFTDTPKPLSVLWRTRLGPPRFSNITEQHVSWEADMRSIDVNLTLSKDGKITGDFEMILPSIRGVQLDPHTGILCFPHVPVETVTWKSFYEFNMERQYSTGEFTIKYTKDLKK